MSDDVLDEGDGCIGALLNGQADCDGYADAMFLVGRLAGLNVRRQYGDSANGGVSGWFTTHMWNLIELDGSWRMMDVTWMIPKGCPAICGSTSEQIVPLRPMPGTPI